MHRVQRSINLAGGTRRAGGGRSGRFTGSRIGRGAGVGRVLASSGRAGRRVVVKARIVKLAGKGAAAARAHMRYLQRDGTTREGERGSLYGADRDVADGRAFHERGVGDRHQFRFIVAAEDGAEYQDLKPLVRRLMDQAEQDLRTRLDWVAVDHFNTGHPHSHVVVRGKDDRGKDLIIAPEYMTTGLRERATRLVDIDLGPRSEREIMRARLSSTSRAAARPPSSGGPALLVGDERGDPGARICRPGVERLELGPSAVAAFLDAPLKPRNLVYFRVLAIANIEVWLHTLAHD